MFSKKGAEIRNQAQRESNPSHEEEEVKERFVEAITKKDVVALGEILKKKERHQLVNTPLPKGTLPLNVACIGGAEEIVRLLIEKGADVTKSDATGWTCLHSACSVERNTKVLKLIIAQDAVMHNARTDDGSTPLHFFARYSAINRDLIYLFEIMVHSGGEVNAQNKIGETPLHRAVTRLKGDLLMTELLLKNGADPNILNSRGESPLHLALLTAPLKHKNDNATNYIVEMLLVHGASIDVKTERQKTPLDIAFDNRLGIPATAIRKEKALRDWLASLGLSDQIDTFRAHRITALNVREITEQTLDQMGIKDEKIRNKILENKDKISPVEEVVFPLNSNKPPTQLRGLSDVSPAGIRNGPPPTQKAASEAVLLVRSAKLERNNRIAARAKEGEKEAKEDRLHKTERSRSLRGDTPEKERKKNHTSHAEGSPRLEMERGKERRAVTISSSDLDDIKNAPRPKKRWEIPLTEVALGSLLGEGGAGSVFRGDWRGLPVALKRLNDQSLRSDQVQLFIDEIDMMSELRHPNVVQFLGASLEPGNMFFITQLAEKGNLHDVVTKENPPFKQRVQFMRDVARGMNYLHQNSPPILHRDLKSMNILIEASNKAMLCDFGISRQIDGSKLTGKGQFTGTFYWMAPDDKQTIKSDVYSYGLVMWEALTGEFPYYQYKLSQLIINVHTKGERPPIPEGTHPEYVALMQRCWAQDPDARPLFAETLKALEALLASLE